MKQLRGNERTRDSIDCEERERERGIFVLILDRFSLITSDDNDSCSDAFSLSFSLKSDFDFAAE